MTDLRNKPQYQNVQNLQRYEPDYYSQPQQPVYYVKQTNKTAIILFCIFMFIGFVGLIVSNGELEEDSTQIDIQTASKVELENILDEITTSKDTINNRLDYLNTYEVSVKKELEKFK